WAAMLLTVGCGDGELGGRTLAEVAGGGGDGQGSSGVGASGGTGGASEVQPEPAEGDGVSDPASRSLHGHDCDGIDWQLVDGWLLLPHKPVETTPAGEIERCVERYAGWVTNEADMADVSRASVYAALAAAGQCDADGDYDGALLPGPLCASAH